MTCDLYVIGHEHQTFGHAVKVGIANNATDRLRSLQTGNAENLKLFFCFTFEDRKIAADVERIFHQSEMAGPIRGEWVGAPPDEVLFYLTIIISTVLARTYHASSISDVRRDCGLMRAFDITDHITSERQEVLLDVVEMAMGVIS